MVTVEIRNQQKRIPLNSPQINKIARKILKHERIRRAHLSIVFVTDQKIRALNKKFLKRDRPTDVLAFDLTDPPRHKFRSQSGKRTRHKELDGEIVISTVTAHKNARRFGTSPYREVLLYAVHGILHLLGYDDNSPQDRKRIREKEKELMGLILS